MNKIVILLSFLVASTFTFAQGFLVRNFTADIYLCDKGYFDVVENYDVEFTLAQHGIFREIITDYKLQTANGKTEKRKLIIENIEVPLNKFEVNSTRMQRLEGKVVIKIGDKKKSITGLHHYEIKYRVYNAFLFEDDAIQFYWNIKPKGWLAVFEAINFNIHTPNSIMLSPENCFLYAGNSGTTIPSTDFDYSYSNGVFSGKSHEYTYSVPGQDVTVLVKLPVGSIEENFISLPIWQEYGWIGILGLVLVAFWFVWLKYGKDDKVISATSYYPPKGIDPAMAGFLINDKDDTSDLISLIPHWASQGFITIEEIPKEEGLLGKADMKLTRLKNIPETSPDYEQRIFSSVFGIWGEIVLISNLRNTFYVTMNQAKKELHAAAQNFYEPHSKKIMRTTIIIAIILGLLLCPIFLFTYGPLAAVLAPIVCVFIALMSFYLQKKNSQGNAVMSELKGFKQFIKIAEINRIEMLIKQDPKYFEKTMSYALTFGLLDQWAKKFDALNQPPPDWYSSSSASTIGIMAFSKSFSSSMATASYAMVSSPSSSGSSSSGGGSSGGGFGGGGGGSW